jgi:hypothetical protein
MVVLANRLIGKNQWRQRLLRAFYPASYRVRRFSESGYFTEDRQGSTAAGQGRSMRRWSLVQSGNLFDEETGSQSRSIQDRSRVLLGASN